MLTDIIGQMNEMYPDGTMRRQAHPKMHGLLAAEFIVEPDLPPHLREGVFAEPVTYPCWIRLSNASTKPKPDKKKDTRGFAIKLVGVPGEKLLPEATDGMSQDFLLVSSEAFLAKDLKEFACLIKAVTSGKMAGYLINLGHIPILLRLGKELIKVPNLLQVPYWSAVPYQFGKPDQAVKYHLRPVSPVLDEMPHHPTDDFLREKMIATLQQHEVWYDFMVQFQNDPEKQPIEDPTHKWETPFIKVASLRIPLQEFDTPERREYGQNLSFNPWHSLSDHRPLGCFSRARKVIYPAVSSHRLERNGIKPPAVVPPTFDQ